MHLDSAGATQQSPEVSTTAKACAACQTPFYAKRKWQRFCGAPCRNLYHQSMTPEALRRDIDTLKHQIAELQGQAHAPFDFGDLVRRLEEVERQFMVLSEPVR